MFLSKELREKANALYRKAWNERLDLNPIRLEEDRMEKLILNNGSEVRALWDAFDKDFIPPSGSASGREDELRKRQGEIANEQAKTDTINAAPERKLKCLRKLNEFVFK